MMHEPEEFDQAEAEAEETVADKELSQLIDLWLIDVRPERYDATDKSWMDSVVSKAKEALKDRRRDDEVIEDAARRRVYMREGTATRRTNKILRDINETGQLPLGWGEGDDWRRLLYDLRHLPLSIDKQRVQFGAASPTDLEQWELQSSREEDKRRVAEAGSRSGARLLAQWMRQQQVQRIDDLRASGRNGERS